jgi:hypothetical protein
VGWIKNWQMLIKETLRPTASGWQRNTNLQKFWNTPG